MRIGKDQTQYLVIREGLKVEACNGEEGVWYKAIIERESKFDHIGFRLLKDNYHSRIAECSMVRPVPPHHLLARVDIKQGRRVEAYHETGWWAGVVIKEVDDDKCLVFFKSPPDIVQFERKDLRPQLDWIWKKYWVQVSPGHSVLSREPMFNNPGSMVEVSSKNDNMEAVWVPAMIIVELKKKYIVKFCNKPSSCKGEKANVTVDMAGVRPTPPPCIVEEFKISDYVEVFRSSKWCKGIVKKIISQKQYMVSFEGKREQLEFSHSDLRLPMEWENGVWKMTEEQNSEDDCCKSKRGKLEHNLDLSETANEYFTPASPSLVLTETPLKETEAETETQEKTLPKSTNQLSRDQNGLGRDSTGEKEMSKNKNQKRKREQSVTSVANVEETRADDTTMVLPFEKKSPVWKTVESMEVFKTNPQSPHFSPLVETSDASRELSAVGMMLTFSTLLEEVKNLQPFDPKSKLESLSDSFFELEKHGFDVKAPHLRIHTILSLKDRQTENMEELKGAEKEIVEKESKKVETELKILEISQKILELQRWREKTDKEISHIKPATIVQKLDDLKLQFHATVSAPW